MATQTVSTTIADSGSLSSAQATQIAVSIAEMVRDRYVGHSEVTTITITFSSNTVTVAIA